MGCNAMWTKQEPAIKEVDEGGIAGEVRRDRVDSGD
jgi:hypothetical protein